MSAAVQSQSEPLTFNFAAAQVLVVDANQAATTVLCQILSGFGFKKFLRCQAVEDAPALLRTHAVDLILFDPFAFGRSAFEWVRWLRTQQVGGSAGALVVIVSSQASVDEVSAAKESGCDYVVAKPFSPAVLLERLIWCARRERPSGFMTEHQPSVALTGGEAELW